MNSSKNIKHIWSLLCRNSSVDKETNNLSAFDIVEQIQLKDKELIEFLKNKPKEFILPINLQLITLWGKIHSNIPTKGEEIVQLLDPDNREIAIIKQPFEIQSKQTRFRLIININGFKFTGGGEYRFLINIRDLETNERKEVAQIPLQIDLT